MSDTENKKNATERLEDLEKVVHQIIQALQPMEPMARDLGNFKEALKLLNNKLDAVVKASNQGETITDEAIASFMTENNVKELSSKVTQMVESGLLAATDTISKESFVIINEADASGKIVNPRMQFLLSSLQHEEVRNKLDGAKTGDNIPVGDQGASINVLEAYNIITPKAPEAAAAPAEDAQSASADATPEAAPAEATA